MEENEKSISTIDDMNNNNIEQKDSFIYFKSSSIISILIIVIFTLVCILITTLLIKTTLHSHNISQKLISYFGFIPNRTDDQTILTYWSPKSLTHKQTIEITTTTTISTHSPPPTQIILNHSERKVKKNFRNIFLPCLFLASIFCGIFAFYMRLHHHIYPAWGARPKRPKHYLTIKILNTSI